MIYPGLVEYQAGPREAFKSATVERWKANAAGMDGELMKGK